MLYDVACESVGLVERPRSNAARRLPSTDAMWTAPAATWLCFEQLPKASGEGPGKSNSPEVRNAGYPGLAPAVGDVQQICASPGDLHKTRP